MGIMIPCPDKLCICKNVDVFKNINYYFATFKRLTFRQTLLKVFSTSSCNLNRRFYLPSCSISLRKVTVFLEPAHSINGIGIELFEGKLSREGKKRSLGQ